MALQPWRKGNVIRIVDHTATTKRFWIEVPDTASFDFIPGQFITLDLPIHEKVNKRWRSYSIASWPDNSNVFELVVVLLEGGAGTQYLFNEISVGSELTFRGPQGVFILKETDLQKDIFLICTGTGIAPFRSMAHHIKLNNIPHKDIYLLFGTRTKKICYTMRSYYSCKGICPVFITCQHFPGMTGMDVRVMCIQYTKSYVEKNQPAIFFLCGWKNMIDEAKKRIVDMGYDRKSIHQELYG